MEIKDLEQILGMLKHSDVTEFELDREGVHLKVFRGQRVVSAPASHVVAAVEPAIVGAINGQAVGNHAASAAASATTANETPSHLTKVESPIVGTFYRKPSPDAPTFVKEGSMVKKGDTLCIIEAMKLMNEIESPCDGRVEKILLSDGKVVEFGEVLFLINPAA